MSRTWDFYLFSLILAIGSLSLLTLFAVNKNLALTQGIYWILGLVALIFAWHFNYQSWKKISVGFYLVTIAALIVLLITGDPVRGSVRWFNLGIFRIQPSEIAKVATVITLSTFFVNRSANKISNLVLSFFIVLPLMVLIFIQPDIGNAMAIFAIWLGITFAAGFRLKLLAMLAVVSIIGVFLTFEMLAPYQKHRITSFLNPQEDPLGIGYNIIQAKIAVGSGQLFGRGLGKGTQSQLDFLPEAESDFIFASLTEQIGLVGSFLLIAFFIVMSKRILDTINHTDRFGQLLIAAIVSLLIFQFTVNVGMNIGLLPITGITLPLVSYGGSSLITVLFLLGICFSIKKREFM